MTFIVALKNGSTLKVVIKDNPHADSDVALYRAKQMGWDAVSAQAVGE